MSNKDFAKNLIDQIPENKLIFVIPYLQGAAIPDEVPNAETVEAIAEVEQMIQSGTGEHFDGTSKDFFQCLQKGDGWHLC